MFEKLENVSQNLLWANFMLCLFKTKILLGIGKLHAIEHMSYSLISFFDISNFSARIFEEKKFVS